MYRKKKSGADKGKTEKDIKDRERHRQTEKGIERQRKA
jgi:hypothetical protein